MKKILIISILCTILLSLYYTSVSASRLDDQPAVCTLDEAVTQDGLYIMTAENTFINIRPNTHEYNVGTDNSEHVVVTSLDPKYQIYKMNPNDIITLFGETDFAMYPVLQTGWTIENEVYPYTKSQKLGIMENGTYTNYTEYNDGPIDNIFSRVIELTDSMYLIEANPYEEFTFGRYSKTKYETKKYVADRNYYVYDGYDGFGLYSKSLSLKYTLKTTKNGYSIVEFEKKPSDGYYVICRRFDHGGLFNNYSRNIIIQVDKNYTSSGTQSPNNDNIDNSSNNSNIDKIINDYGTTSTWADNEVNEAGNNGLIPDTLIGKDLTQKVSRSEFAAIAVLIYEKLSDNHVYTSSSPFTDIGNDPNKTSINQAYKLGITVGTSSTTFEPSTHITREQLATMFCRAIKKYMFPEWTPETDYMYYIQGVSGRKYADDAEISDYARQSVYFMRDAGIIKGVDNDYFAPKASVSYGDVNYGMATREQAIIMSLRIMKNKTYFDDI